MNQSSQTKTSPYKAIFWDNDGVLVDTEQYYLKANQDIFKEQGFELTLASYQENFLLKSCGAWHLLQEAKPELLESDISFLKEKRNKRYEELISEESIEVRGAGEILEALFPKYYMAVVTSAYRQHFDLIHQRTGFLKYFQFTLANGEYGPSKPAPEPYLAALKKSGFSKEECLVIEDSKRGLLSAKAAGIDCWIIKTELTKDEDFSDARKVFESLEEIRQHLV